MSAATIPQVRLKIERRSSHPWIYQRMVEKPERRIAPGTVVDILDRDGSWAGRGFYNAHSRIKLRVLTTDPAEEIDEAFFARRIGRAIELRRDVLGLDRVADAYRLVHSEGDDLSGLVVDRFGPYLVIEIFSAGMYRFLPAIQSALRASFPEASCYWFAEEHVQKQESIDVRPPDPLPAVTIVENGVRFRVQPGGKHKTGFFVDQRENRRALADLTRGRRVLDLCTNSGGFAVYAKSIGEAAEVVGVDLDESAIELARRNADLNQVRIRFVQADLFAWLRDAAANGERFDVIVLDPSKQTRSREEVDMALKRYRDMNRLALQVASPGAFFVSCSCTGLVREDDFLGAIHRGAYQAGRRLQVIRTTGAGPDHPFLAHVPESRYLKTIWGRVL